MDFLTGREIANLSRRTPYHGVSNDVQGDCLDLFQSTVRKCGCEDCKTNEDPIRIALLRDGNRTQVLTNLILL
jgi:hypothetical protein